MTKILKAKGKVKGKTTPPVKKKAGTAGKKKDARISPKSTGRPAGVGYKVTDEYNEKLTEAFEQFETLFEEYEVGLTKLLEDGNKSAAAIARKTLSNIAHLCKSTRVDLQEAKVSMEQVKI